MNFVALEFETLPDLGTARRVHGLDEGLDDRSVGNVIFHHHQHRGMDSPFLSPHLRSLTAWSAVLCRDEDVCLVEPSSSDLSESRLLEECGYLTQRSGCDLVAWDAGRDLSELIVVRALMNGVMLEVTGIRNEDELGINSLFRHELAECLGIPSEPLPSDESNWKQVRKEGRAKLLSRCRLNAVATARLWLQHKWRIGDLTDADLNDMDARASALLLPESNVAVQ